MTAPVALRQYCTFHVADHYFGVEVERVQEVLREQPMTAVPLASEVVGGLINLRGQIVTAVDMRRRLGMPPRTDRAPMNVVLRTDDGAVALLVDEIGDVVEADLDGWEARPDTVRGPARDLIAGAYQTTGQLLLVLDVDQALDFGGTGPAE